MTDEEKTSIRDLLKTADINLSERQTNILCRAFELSITKGYEQGLAEGKKEGYEQGKNNERESQCGKKNYEKDISRLEKENADLKEDIKTIVNAFNNYECSGTEQEQTNTWEILSDVMHEALEKYCK